MITVFSLLAILLTSFPISATNTEVETQSYHSSLITHWDFEGEGAEIYADKATSGTSDDTLTATGDSIVVNDGVAYISDTVGNYLSATGTEDTDLYDFKNKTVVVKAALVNHADGRSVVAGFISKESAFAYFLGNDSSGNVSNMLIRVNNKNNVLVGEATVMEEFRVFAMVMEYDEAANTLTAKYYMSTKEVPESAADFQLMVEQTVEITTEYTVVTSDKDLILGRRYDHTDAARNLRSYFDDVKVYSDVLTLDEIAADCPEATDYQIRVEEGGQVSKVPDVNTNYEKMKNLTMYAIGDSYFAGHGGVGLTGTWPSLLASKYEMTATIDAVGGSTVANWSGYAERKKPMVLRYKDSVPTGDVDIILIEGGRNDRGRLPIGTNDSTDINTFKGALNVMISDLKTKFPNALIICVTTWNAQDYTNPSTVEYAEAMVELCASRNDVKCINAADPEVSGVDINVAEFRQNYCVGPNDHSHLNRDGMRLVLPYFEESIARLYYDHIGEAFVDQTPGEYYKETASGGDHSDPPTTDDGTNDPETPTDTTEPDASSTDNTVTDGDNTAEESGCGSSLGLSAVVLATVASASCAVKHKKDKKSKKGE